MPTVAHSARISSLDLKRGPSAVGFIMRYHSSQTAPGIRPFLCRRQASCRPDIVAAMDHLDLGIAEHGQEIIAAAGLAETGIHRLFVDDRGFLAREPGAAEGVGELG